MSELKLLATFGVLAVMLLITAFGMVVIGKEQWAVRCLVAFLASLIAALGTVIVIIWRLP